MSDLNEKDPHTFGGCRPLWNVDLIATSIVAILLSCEGKELKNIYERLK